MGSRGFWGRAREDPHWTVVIEADGTVHAAGDLQARVNQISRGLLALGLRPGDGLAALLPNGVAPLEVYLAALQSGWYFTPLNWHFTPPEIAYIVRDCEAKALFVADRFGDAGAAAADLAGLPASARFSYGPVPGFTPVEELRSGHPITDPPGRTSGTSMLYTSGTTGRPKGVRRRLTGQDPDDMAVTSNILLHFFGFTEGPAHAHLMTAPNYHAAGTIFGTGAVHLGHTLVCMDGWDAERALELTERFQITNTHMVPTQFKRMLALPWETRQRYDLSSMQWLLHGAAPCPPGIKQAMFEWWGPVLYEYYAATEGGGTMATPQDWLARPGTVGRTWPGSKIMIVGPDGQPCPPGEPGGVFMSVGPWPFAYKDDPVKTASSMRGNYFTVGDIGYLDEDGYLFLCDRKDDQIVSGGVNIYPAEVEAELIMHPQVADVAVFGIPDDEWGEQVKAVIQLAPGVVPSDELATVIVGSLEGRLAHLKWPKSVDFADQLPRDPNGKLMRRRLRDEYWRDYGRVI